MTRLAQTPRPIRAGAAVLTAAGAFVLAGCAGPAEDTSSVPDSTDEAGGATEGSASGASYADGSYTASGAYATPESVEEISVTVTLEGDVVTAVEVTGNPTQRESEQYQSQFIGGISDEVVGKDIDDLNVSRVAGSSLTSSGFNEAIEAIKEDALA